MSLLGLICFVSILFLSACSNEPKQGESGSNEGKVSLTMTAGEILLSKKSINEQSMRT